MRKLLPFGLLVPVAVLLGLFIASQFGYVLPYGTPSSALLGALAWLLLFLIIFGYMRRWRSVRIFLVLFVVGKFSAILYRHFVFGVSIDHLLVELGSAAIVTWLMVSFFWPRNLKYEKTAR